MNKSDKKIGQRKSDIENRTIIGQKSDMKSDRKIRKKSVKNKSDQPRDIKQKIGHEHVGQNKWDIK